MTVRLATVPERTRYFNGHVNRIEQVDPDGRLACYRVSASQRNPTS